MIADQIHEQAQDIGYDAFIQSINDRFNSFTGPVFETNATGLYEAYLAGFEGADRQYHTCNCCRAFIERFGGLAMIDDNGAVVSAIWGTIDTPDVYLEPLANMARIVRRAAITMPFLSSDTMYGTPISGERKDGTGAWHHFAIKPTAARVYKASPLKTAFQAASEKREEFNSVSVALAEYGADTIATALNLLKNDQLGRSEAAVAQAQFLADLHSIEAARGSVGRSNLIFRAVAQAPSGFCHPRSGMIATLLDDIAAGKSFDRVQASWNAKMHPLAYQRPQAAPTAGAIKAAEEAFNKLGAASALKRRFARLDDVLEKLWQPKEAAPAAGGIFGSVKAKGETPAASSLNAPAITMTWAKFSSTVLPGADKIEVNIGYGHEGFAALTTAVDPDAVPLLQWDSAERRNPVALYLWNGGSPALQWNLEPGQFHKVNAVTLRPSMWFGADLPHQSQGALFIIDNCRDSREGAGSALFPSTLRSEYHGYRSVIEGFSKANELEGRNEQSASGLLIGKEGTGNVQLRVTSAGQTTDYRIDRWD